MNVEIYSRGCTTCGGNASLIARVKNRYPNAVVYNTRYAGAPQVEKHIEYLKRSGIGTGSMQAIVVENNGEVITLLREWK